MTEDETVGWHHQLNRHEFEQALGDGEGQGSLACCSLWGSVQFSSVAQLCPTLCEPMNRSTSGLPQLLEYTQTHVRRVGDEIQPSHPLSSPAPPALGLSQHQGLFK